jgi:hypothetical protein
MCDWRTIVSPLPMRQLWTCSWLTESCPDRTLAQVAVPDCSVEANTPCHIVLIYNKRMHEAVVQDSTITVSTYGCVKDNQGQYLRLEQFSFTPKSEIFNCNLYCKTIARLERQKAAVHEHQF